MNENIVNINDAINLNNITDLTNQNDILDPLTPMIEIIMGLDDNNLTDISIEIYKGMLEGIFTKQLRTQLIEEIIKDLNANQITKNEAMNKKNELINNFKSIINELKPTDKKLQLLYAYVDQIDSIYNEAIEKYGGISIILPIMLEEGAQVPTYAHESDAAADLYAADDMTIPAHSISNMVRTGVHIALPEGWAAIIIPRSSIGAKTGLRLSNSQGLIDTSYRGPLGVIYDNISDSDYEIKKGDRIAQLYMMPVHRFKAKVVDTLEDTDRGENGFGSTGK